MAIAPSIIINLPGSGTALNSVATIAALRALASISLVNGADIVVDGGAVLGDNGGGIYIWDDLSVSADDGASVIKPTDVPVLSAGRWKTVGGGFLQAGTGAVTRTTQAKLRDTVSVKDFGAVGDGVANDTAAFQAALDTLKQVHVPVGDYLITDTLLLEPGVILLGAGGTANFDASPVKIRFTPTTKRDLFNWRSPQAEIYVFGGCYIEGFCVRGFGGGANACVDLPMLYNGYLNFFAFAGIDTWIRLRRWLDCDIKGGTQGFAIAAVDFAKAGSTGDAASDVTTTLKVDAYIAHGPIAYRAADRTITDCVITGQIESVDKALDMARGNIMSFDKIFTENAPRTDVGAAWVAGKTGTSGVEATALSVNFTTGIGWTGGTAVNATLFDVGAVRELCISGKAFQYVRILATTADTQQVTITAFDTDNIPSFAATGGIADYTKITATGFRPKSMLLTPTGAEFIDFPVWTRSIDLIPRPRAGVPNGKIIADKTYNGKIIRRDEFGNFTAPIGHLRVSGVSAWTVQGGRLTPGELVQNTATTRGQPGLWLSTRFTKDAAANYSGCSTTVGSPIITNPTVGTFFLCEVGDYVTVSAGYADAVLQRQVIARTADLTSITLDSNATSTVAGTVGVSTEAHNLIPLAQQGSREVAADPVGVQIPNFKGEELFRTDTSNWYKSTGTAAADWKLLT